MDEILLTPEQIESEGWAAFDAWEKLGQTRKLRGDPDEAHRAFTAFCNAWLCRAQLRKAVERMEKRNQAHGVWSEPGEPRPAIHLYLGVADWQALRAAAEEVRG